MPLPGRKLGASESRGEIRECSKPPQSAQTRTSKSGRERAAAMYSLIATTKLNEVDPRAWLADVIARIADRPVRRLAELLPWHWRETQTGTAVAA